MVKKYIAGIVFILSIFCISNVHSQVLWGIEVGDQNQYNTWEEDGGYRVKTGVDLWGTAKFKDGVLEMSLPDGKDADFQSAFIEIVQNYGQPSLFKDRNIMLEKEKHKQDSIDAYIATQKKINPRYKHKADTTVVPEDTRNVDQMVADGDMTMKRNWILVDYEMELVYDQYGVRFQLKYLK